jgi:hypothetical protein
MRYYYHLRVNDTTTTAVQITAPDPEILDGSDEDIWTYINRQELVILYNQWLKYLQLFCNSQG